MNAEIVPMIGEINAMLVDWESSLRCFPLELSGIQRIIASGVDLSDNAWSSAILVNDSLKSPAIPDCDCHVSPITSQLLIGNRFFVGQIDSHPNDGVVNHVTHLDSQFDDFHGFHLLLLVEGAVPVSDADAEDVQNLIGFVVLAFCYAVCLNSKGNKQEAKREYLSLSADDLSIISLILFLFELRWSFETPHVNCHMITPKVGLRQPDTRLRRCAGRKASQACERGDRRRVCEGCQYCAFSSQPQCGAQPDQGRDAHMLHSMHQQGMKCHPSERRGCKLDCSLLPLLSFRA